MVQYEHRIMSTKETIQKILAEVVKEITGLEVKPQLESPSLLSHGDYTTNIAMVLFGKSKESRTKNQEWKAPLELAKKIADKTMLHASSSVILEKVEAVAPGFINIWFSKDYLFNQLALVLKEGETFGTTNKLKDKKIMIEFTDPNPFKEFHIGHLYSNIVGESLARLLESQHAIVKRANYQGDIGLHVAKALWGIQQRIKSQESGIINFHQLESKSLTERIKFMGEAYAHGAQSIRRN
jgi:arginyl-tRNA synthetase